MKYKFLSGKYYIGDPCYAVKDENWSKLCDETHCFGSENLKYEVPWNGLFSYNNEICFTDGTKYGDGCFQDNYGREYGVDAGLIGIMPLEVCDGDSMNGGQIVDFENDFMVWSDDGEFHFGDVVIQTRDEEEDEWEDDEEEDDDEDWE
jgi:hypothetical protein